MVEQQIYTRLSTGEERVFGTCARSPELPETELDFLESLCTYNVPYRMIHQEKPSENPEISVFAIQDGYAAVGRSIYRADDGRATFLCHNYLVNLRDNPRLTEDVPALTGATGFLREPPLGETLSSLPDIPTEQDINPLNEKEAILVQCRLSDGIFAALIASLFSAIAENRKLFIALPCRVKDQDRRARSLMRLIMLCFPHELRQELTYTTYFSEGSTLSSIRIYFVDPLLLPPVGNVSHIGDHTLEKDALFDMAHSRIQNAQNGRNSMFISYIIHNYYNRPVFTKLFEHISQLLRCLPDVIPEEGKRFRFLSNLRIYDRMTLAQTACLSEPCRLSDGISGILELFRLFCPENPSLIPFAKKTLACYAAELKAAAKENSLPVPPIEYLQALSQLSRLPGLFDVCADTVTGCALIALSSNSTAMKHMMARLSAENDTLYTAVLSSRSADNLQLICAYIGYCLSEADSYPLLFSYFLRQRLSYPAITEHPVFTELFHSRMKEIQSQKTCTLPVISQLTHILSETEALSQDIMALRIYGNLLDCIASECNLSTAIPEQFCHLYLNPQARLRLAETVEKFVDIKIIRQICLAFEDTAPLPLHHYPEKMIAETLETLNLISERCEPTIKVALRAMLSRGDFSESPKAFPLLLYSCFHSEELILYFHHYPRLLADFLPFYAQRVESPQSCRIFINTVLPFYRSHPELLLEKEDARHLYQCCDQAQACKGVAATGIPLKQRITEIRLSALPPSKRLFARMFGPK